MKGETTMLVETYRRFFEDYLQKNKYKKKTYQSWLNAWFNIENQEIKGEIQDYSNKNWLRKWWLRQTTDITLKLTLNCIRTALSENNPPGFMVRLSELKAAVGWFSLLRWSLWFME